jgi:hypothetical protein
MNIKVEKQFNYPMRDIEHYIKEYIGNFNAVSYDENEDIQTIKEEHKNKDVYVFDTFATNQEQEALSSAIYFLGEKIENTYDDEWIDSEKLEHEETMKHLCRLYGRYSNRNGRKLI